MYPGLCNFENNDIEEEKALSLKRKLETIGVLENSKKSNRQLVEELGVPISTPYDIWNENEQLKDRCSSGTDWLNSERQRTASHAEVDKGLLDWLRYTSCVNILYFTFIIRSSLRSHKLMTVIAQ